MIRNCFSVGLSYKTLGDRERGRFSLDIEKQLRLYREVHEHFENDSDALVILDTCNRTELYGAGDSGLVADVYKRVTGVPASVALDELRGVDAVKHIFNVAAGLDSQIVGDVEILGQFKNAIHSARHHGTLSGYFEKLATTAIRSSKEIRRSTHLTRGTVSVGYAAVSYLRNHLKCLNPNLLVIGSGKIGSRVARHIRSYLPSAHLTLTNRTLENAQAIAGETCCRLIPLHSISEHLSEFDAIVVTARTDGHYLLTPDMPWGGKQIIVVDISVPSAVHPELESLDDVHVVSVDKVSSIIAETVESRKSHLPVAMEIIDKYTQEFYAWSCFRNHAGTLGAWRAIVESMAMSCPHVTAMPSAERDRYIAHQLKGFSVFLRNNAHHAGHPEALIASYLDTAHGNTCYAKSDSCNRCPLPDDRCPS